MIACTKALALAHQVSCLHSARREAAATATSASHAPTRPTRQATTHDTPLVPLLPLARYCHDTPQRTCPYTLTRSDATDTDTYVHVPLQSPHSPLALADPHQELPPGLGRLKGCRMPPFLQWGARGAPHPPPALASAPLSAPR
eukprot:scaffold224144_cov35-Tisochrysis_lutea.AAC.2